jgi:hypothetical protein
MEAEFKKQDEVKKAKDESKVSAEDQAEALEAKITAMIKEKKKEADEAIKADQKKEKAEKEMAFAAYKAKDAEVKREVAGVEAETEHLNLSAAEIRARASKARKHMTDEEYIANLPEHHLEGYVQLGDDDKKEEPKEEIVNPKENVKEDSMEELIKLEAEADKQGGLMQKNG